jgi:hypothetical protein
MRSRSALTELMQSVGADKAKFLRFFKIEQLAELPASASRKPSTCSTPRRGAEHGTAHHRMRAGRAGVVRRPPRHPDRSEFSTVMAKGKDGGKSVTRKTYMLKLAGEILTGEPMESYSNVHMERGKEQEAEAREAYELMRDVDCQQVGFIVNGDKGCSPDSLIGSDGGLEIKTALPHIQVERLLKGDCRLSIAPRCRAICG